MAAIIEYMINLDFGKLMNQGDTLKKFLDRMGGDISVDERDVSSPLVDIVSTPKNYVFYIDVPGLSKSHVQVQVEEDNVLVIRTNGKRKREEGEEEGCKYLKLERVAPQKMMRKFRLPQDADVSSISAKCENGVLTVTIAKVTPVKPKTVQVTIA